MLGVSDYTDKTDARKYECILQYYVYEGQVKITTYKAESSFKQ